MAWPALGPGRLLERCGNAAPRGMTVHDRTRLIGRLPIHRGMPRHAPRYPVSVLSVSVLSVNVQSVRVLFLNGTICELYHAVT